MTQHKSVEAGTPALLEALEIAAIRFARIKETLWSERLNTSTARASFANDVWHMECDARDALSSARGNQS